MIICISNLFNQLSNLIYSTSYLLQGMPGAPGMKMYSREDLMNQNFGSEDGDDDEDDDAEEFPSNLVRERSNTSLQNIQTR